MILHPRKGVSWDLMVYPKAPHRIDTAEKKTMPHKIDPFSLQLSLSSHSVPGPAWGEDGEQGFLDAAPACMELTAFGGMYMQIWRK